MPDEQPLIIVSNRGPAQFERTEEGERKVDRGGGGLVTALSGLVSHRKALWVASAMTDEDVAVAREADGKPVDINLGGIDYHVCMVESDSEAYDRFYNTIANPILGSSSTTSGTFRTRPTSDSRRSRPGSTATRP